MTTMIAEVYDAFRSAGADEDKARAAAQAIADYQRNISELKTELKQDISELKTAMSELRVENIFLISPPQTHPVEAS